MDTPRPTRPGIGNGARWSDIQATLDRVDNAINDLDTGHPDSAQVATDMRAAIEATALEHHARVTKSFGGLAERVTADMPTPSAVSADAAFAVRGAYEDRFLDTEPPPPLTYEQLIENIRLLDQMDPPPEPIQLTQEQLDLVPKAPPRKPWELDPAFFGIPVHRVDNVEESTPYQLERARHIEEQHVELCGCNWDHPANVPPAQPGWLTRAIRRIFG